MRSVSLKATFLSYAFPVTVTALVLVVFDAAIYLADYLHEHLHVNSIFFSVWLYPLLIVLGILTGFLSNRFPLKKTLPVTLGFLVVWLILTLVAANIWQINLYFLRVAFVTLTVLIGMHIKKLLKIDRELTENLVSLATSGSMIEIRPAESRIENGLRLLETVLPLSEAIVFSVDRHNEFRPVGRSRPDTPRSAMRLRHAEWRETIGLCERALGERVTLVIVDDPATKAARVALPLVYEDNSVGVLFVKIQQNFERADQQVLEAFSEQLARNFKRQELRCIDLPNSFWWSFMSTNSAENRVGVISLIRSLIKEHSFGAVASSYLKEAHAIAYLDGTLAYVNRRMRHLVDPDSDGISDLNLFGLLDQFRTDAFSEPHLAIRRVLQTGEAYRNQLSFERKNKFLDLQISLVKVPQDNVSIHETNVALKPACFLITLTDITATKENERLRSDLVSLMSHELRTPVTSIKGFAEILLMDEAISDENREFLQIIANESQRLSAMLSTFLSVSNLEQSDKQGFTKSAVRLDTVVTDVVGQFRETAKRKRIRLVEKNTANLPPIAADRGLIRRAISNLIDNAIRYSPERTQVMISTILEADFLRVTVEDRGYGIDHSDQDKIWEKFYRVAREGQDKENESTGLGLSLVKEVVEQHGGRVGVESEVGRGSKFSIALPRL